MRKHPIVRALTDEQIERLRDGEKIKVAVELREPLFEKDISTSFNEITVTLSTRGTTAHLDSQEDLAEHFPDVEGLERLIDDE